MATRKKGMPGQSSLSGIDWGSFETPPDKAPNRKPTGILPTAKHQRGSRRARKLPTAAVFTQEEQSDPLPWHQMSSSRVMTARYDPGNAQVQVYFVDGTPWVYEDVPRQVYDAFITASSAGRFINQVLDNYPYRRAEPSEMGNW